MDKSKFVLDYLKSHVDLLYHKALSEHETSKKCHHDTVQSKQRSHSITGLQDDCLSYKDCLKPDQNFQHNTAGIRERLHRAISLQDQRSFCENFSEPHKQYYPQTAEIKKRSYGVTDLQVQRPACLVDLEQKENQNKHLFHCGELLTQGHNEHDVRSENANPIDIAGPMLKQYFSKSKQSENNDNSYLSSESTGHSNSHSCAPTKLSEKESRRSVCISKIHGGDKDICKSAMFCRTAEAVITRNEGIELNVDDKQAKFGNVPTDLPNRNKGILLVNPKDCNPRGITLHKKKRFSERSVSDLNMLGDSKSCITNSESRSKETNTQFSEKQMKETDSRLSSSETKRQDYEFMKSQSCSKLDANIYQNHLGNTDKCISEILNHKQEHTRSVLASPHDRCLQDAANLDDVVFFTADQSFKKLNNKIHSCTATNSPVTEAVNPLTASDFGTLPKNASDTDMPVEDLTVTTSLHGEGLNLTTPLPVEGLTLTTPAHVEGLTLITPGHVEGLTLTTPVQCVHVEGLTVTSTVEDLTMTSPVEDSTSTSLVTDLTSVFPVCDFSSPVDNLTLPTSVKKVTTVAPNEDLKLTSQESKAVPAILQDKLEQPEKILDVASQILLPLTIQNVGQLPGGEIGDCDSDNNSNKSCVIWKKDTSRKRNEKTDDQTKEHIRKRKRHRSRDRLKKRPTLHRACTLRKKSKIENSNSEPWTARKTQATIQGSSKPICSGARQQKPMPNNLKKGLSTSSTMKQTSATNKKKTTLRNTGSLNTNHAKSASVKDTKTRLTGKNVMKNKQAISEKSSLKLSLQEKIQRKHENNLLHFDTPASIDKLNCLERKTLKCVTGDADIYSVTSHVDNVMPLVDVTQWSNGKTTYRISNAVSDRFSDLESRQHPGGIWKSIFQEN